MLRRKTKDIVRGGFVRTALQQKQPSTGDEEIEKRNADIDAARKKLLYRVVLPTAALLLLLVFLFLLLADRKSEKRPELPKDGYLLAVPAEDALLEVVSVGDVVRLYSPAGDIPSMRYVSVASIAGDSMTLLVSPEQITDYLNADGIVIVPVICNDTEAAQKALEQQAAWNSPDLKLSLSTASLVLEVSQTMQLSPEIAVTPEGAVTPSIVWTSSDDAIVTVSDAGTVTAVGTGTAKITASCGNVSATCTVTVLTCADTLAFDAEAYSTIVGQELVLALISSPENMTETLTWTSSDEAIATVSPEGVVTALSGGSVTISVTGKRSTASCTVNISVPAESIVLNSTSLSVILGRTGQLAAVVMPENASNKTLTWTSSDETIVKVWQDGVVQGLKEGTATITVTCGDVSATCTVTVTQS